MKTRDLLFYLILGAALGAIAGALAAKALRLYALYHPWRGTGAFALAGAIVSAAGAASTGSRRSAWREPLLGFVLAGLGFVALTGSYAISQDAPNVALVFFALVFSAAVAASHAVSLREGNAALAAGFFGGIGGLLALAAGMTLIIREDLIWRCAAAGAVYGALVWLGAGAARRLFSVDVRQFRL